MNTQWQNEGSGNLLGVYGLAVSGGASESDYRHRHLSARYKAGRYRVARLLHYPICLGWEHPTIENSIDYLAISQPSKRVGSSETVAFSRVW